MHAGKDIDNGLCACVQQPERVFAEVFRVLKPGGCFIITFSNRLYYDKVRPSILQMSCWAHVLQCACFPAMLLFRIYESRLCGRRVKVLDTDKGMLNSVLGKACEIASLPRQSTV